MYDAQYLVIQLTEMVLFRQQSRCSSPPRIHLHNHPAADSVVLGIRRHIRHRCEEGEVQAVIPYLRLAHYW